MKKETKALVRDSNMELLRIVAMLLVMIFHAAIVFNDPTQEEAINHPVHSAMYFLLKSFSTICVDVFVLISGWYGIKPKKRSFLSLLFQIVFFLGILDVVQFTYTHEPITFKAAKSLILGGSWDYWFIKSYILLYIISPVLNAFVEHSSKSTFKMVLVAFFVFQTIYGWFTCGCLGFEGGYSTISFMGLYLLARYLNVYKPCMANKSVNRDLLCFILFVFLSTIWSFGLCMTGVFFYDLVFVYTSPFAIMSAVYLLLMFSKLQIKSHVINWIAASAFAVYLFHIHDFIYPHYNETIESLIKNNSLPIGILYSMTFIIGVFVVSILLDKFRVAVWNVVTLLLKDCK